MNSRVVLMVALSVTAAGTWAVLQAAPAADDSKSALERQLLEAKEARVKAARNGVEVAHAMIRSNTAPHVVLVEPARNLVEAEVDLATTPAEQAAAWQHYVDVMQVALEAVTKLRDIGTRGGEEIRYYEVKQEYERARVELLKAQIAAK